MLSSIHFEAFRHAANSGSGFAHDRSETIGASEIGQCARKIRGIKEGLKPDDDYEDDLGYAARGNLIEDHWTVPFVSAWAKGQLGAELRLAGQANQTTITSPKRKLSVTPDGLIVQMPKQFKLGTEVLQEFKSADPNIMRYADTNLPKIEHVWQVIQGMGLLPKSLAPSGLTHAILWYVNASKLTDIKPYVVKHDPALFETFAPRAAKILSTPFEKLPLEGKLKFGGKPCRYCQFKSRCGVEKKTENKGK